MLTLEQRYNRLAEIIKLYEKRLAAELAEDRHDGEMPVWDEMCAKLEETDAEIMGAYFNEGYTWLVYDTVLNNDLNQAAKLDRFFETIAEHARNSVMSYVSEAKRINRNSAINIIIKILLLIACAIIVWASLN